MRIVLAALALSVAAPAAAQTLGADEQLRQMEQQAQMQQLQQRSVAIQNELTTLDARIRTEEALAAVRAQSVRPVIPEPYVSTAPPPASGTVSGRFASIPDDRLAASNARVRETTQQRH